MLSADGQCPLRCTSCSTSLSTAPHVPAFRCVLDDLAMASDEAIRARAMGAFATLALLLLRDARTVDDLQARLGVVWADLLRELVAAPNGVERLMRLLRYVALVNGQMKASDLKQTLSHVLEGHGDEVMTTIAQEWIDEGRKLGVDEGVARAVLRVLKKRGLGVRPEVEARVLACTDLAVLERWLDRAIDARSADDVFADS
jgi:hypothetical protein